MVFGKFILVPWFFSFCLYYVLSSRDMESSNASQWDITAALSSWVTGSDSKGSAYNVGDPSSILGSGRSPGEGNGNPLQYSCPENPVDRGAWWATVHGITKESWTDICITICEFWKVPASKYQLFCFPVLPEDVWLWSSSVRQRDSFALLGYLEVLFKIWEIASTVMGSILHLNLQKMELGQTLDVLFTWTRLSNGRLVNQTITHPSIHPSIHPHSHYASIVTPVNKTLRRTNWS